MRLRFLSKRIRNAAARTFLTALGLLWRERPIPPEAVNAVRLLGVGEDPLARQTRAIPADLAITGPLSPHLKGLEIGTWALGPKSLAFVRTVVSRERPHLAIEFGSGISTAVLALAMRDVKADSDRPLVVSIEQDETHAARTRKLLAEANLAELVVVVVAPLARRHIEGVETTCYLLPDDITRVFGDRRADLVLVDGPAAESGARFGTLPLARPFVSPRAVFILDDALRDGELNVAHRWRSLPYAEIDGIRLVENGLLVGHILGN